MCVAGESLAESDLGVLVDNQLKISQQWANAATKAGQILGYTSRNITSGDRDIIIPLYSVLAGLHLEYCVQFWSPHFKNYVDRLERVQRRAQEPALWRKIEGVGSFLPTAEKAQGELIAVFQYLKGKYREDKLSLHKQPHGEDKGQQFWSFQHRKDMDLLEQVQQRAMNMIRGLEHLSYEDRLRALGLFSPEKRKVQGDLIVAFQYLKEAYRRDGEGLFIREWSNKMSGNGFKLKEGRFG
ncbi:hypothetical protein llap_14474 [Limosa lapponica baueri]|uniref:Uncharacterized protein n=1 Tax=Limosa lapponica baueri TaxID=1758121 RepID=A0A2I0TN26_LIMLA|nr:hypothetical protein llap_14474 [Limosa lapponica baueri]